MANQVRHFAVGVNKHANGVHPGDVHEMDGKPNDGIDVAYALKKGNFAASCYVSLGDNGVAVEIVKYTNMRERNGVWDDSTTVTPSQIRDAARNYIAREEEAAKQADSV